MQSTKIMRQSVFDSDDEQGGILPPSAVEAEQQLIGAILVSEGALLPHIKGQLRSSDFYKRENAIIFDAMLKLDDQADPVDRVSLQIFLESRNRLSSAGGKGYISELILAHDGGLQPERVVYYFKQIIEAKKARELLKAASDAIADIGGNFDGDTTPNARALLGRVQEISERSVTEYTSDLVVLAQQALERLEERSESGGGLPGITTGFDTLDDFTGGWISGALHIIAARPSVGKTALALSMIDRSLTAGNSVAFFSIEMDRESILQRMFSSRSELELRRIRFAQFKDDSEAWQKLYSCLDYASGRAACDIYDITAGDIDTVAGIEAKVKRLIAIGRKPAAIWIDHLQEMRTENDRLNKNDAWDLICKGLKRLAKIFDLPIILLCQLSRATEARQDKRPVLSDLRESGGIEQQADLVVMLYRDDYYNKQSLSAGIMELLVRKQRNGVLGTVHLSFQGSTQSFGDLGHGFSPPASPEEEPKPRYRYGNGKK